jgi:hypothetical protein
MGGENYFWGVLGCGCGIGGLGMGGGLGSDGHWGNVLGVRVSEMKKGTQLESGAHFAAISAAVLSQSLLLRWKGSAPNLTIHSTTSTSPCRTATCSGGSPDPAAFHEIAPGVHVLHSSWSNSRVPLIAAKWNTCIASGHKITTRHKLALLHTYARATAQNTNNERVKRVDRLQQQQSYRATAVVHSVWACAQPKECLKHCHFAGPCTEVYWPHS